MYTPGEEVKAKKENHLTRTRAREREEREKTREDLKGSPLVLFRSSDIWSNGVLKRRKPLNKFYIWISPNKRTVMDCCFLYHACGDCIPTSACMRNTKLIPSSWVSLCSALPWGSGQHRHRRVCRPKRPCVQDHCGWSLQISDEPFCRHRIKKTCRSRLPYKIFR